VRAAEGPRSDRPATERPRDRPWLLPLLVALIVIPYPYFPALRSPNEGSRLYQARAIVDDGTFALDGEIRRYGQMGDLSHSERGYFPNKAPGISFFGAAVYWVARLFAGGEGSRISNETLQYLLRLFCCEIPTLVLLFFLRRELWRWSRDGLAADMVLAAYALGSLAYTYGLLYFGHQLTAVCLMGGFLAIEASRRQVHEGRRLGRLALAGLLAGTAVFVEYPGALAALPLGLYVLWVAARRWRSVLVFGLASLPPQLVLLWYHKVCFGSPFSIGYRNNVNAQFNQWTARGFVVVSLPTWEGFWGSLFSPARGLLIFSPFLILAFYGLAGLARTRKRPELEQPAILMGILTVLYLLFAASFVYEGWGWTVGPRHITPLAAFLTPPAALALAELGKRSPLGRGIGVGLCLLSVVITSLATVTYPHFPEVFTNGFFEVTVPLLAGGYLPRNLLGLVAHAEAFGWMVFFAGWLFLLGWMVARGARSVPGRIAILGTVASGLLLLSVLGRGGSVEKQQMLEFIRRSYRSG
jgi:hypothetical protein